MHGSSVNPVDCAIRSGKLRFFIRLRLPAVLGVDVAGEVVEAGEGVRRFSVGERVFAYTGLARDDLPEAHRRSETGRVAGKIAVVPPGTLVESA